MDEAQPHYESSPPTVPEGVPILDETAPPREPNVPEMIIITGMSGSRPFTSRAGLRGPGLVRGRQSATCHAGTFRGYDDPGR